VTQKRPRKTPQRIQEYHNSELFHLPNLAKFLCWKETKETWYLQLRHYLDFASELIDVWELLKLIEVFERSKEKEGWILFRIKRL
jgi:hypothetical protein